MEILDDVARIKKLDKSGVYHSIISLDKQCQDAWEKVCEIETPDDYKDFSQVIVCGMGGSALGAHVVQSLFQAELRIPLIIVRDYDLPSFVNQDSLVVLSSYSGNTEETLSCAEKAIDRKIKSFIITSGGKLAEIAQSNSLPCYIIDPVYNPCGQPRMATGYSIFGQLALFACLDLISLTEEEVRRTIQLIKTLQGKFSVEVPCSENLAKQIAKEIVEKIPLLVTAQHLIGAAHVFNNQLNENAKHFSNFQVIPELNHHLMEGLAYPKQNSQVLHFIFILSSFYPQRIQQRFKLTKDIVEKNEISAKNIEIPQVQTKLEEVFGLIVLGSFVSFYLAMLHNVDPAPVPWVDYFKKALKE